MVVEIEEANARFHQGDAVFLVHLQHAVHPPQAHREAARDARRAAAIALVAALAAGPDRCAMFVGDAQDGLHIFDAAGQENGAWTIPFTRRGKGIAVIGHVGRIWADGKPLDVSGLTIRVHRGGEDQLPDDLIVAKEGANNAPAYRGLAYVVFERLPLAGFGNRIPQLSFEIVRPIGALERMTRAVTLIPGTTEFGYETSAVVRVLGPGRSAPENRHVTTARSNVIAALDDLLLLRRVGVHVIEDGLELALPGRAQDRLERRGQVGIARRGRRIGRRGRLAVIRPLQPGREGAQ